MLTGGLPLFVWRKCKLSSRVYSIWLKTSNYGEL